MLHCTLFTVRFDTPNLPRRLERPPTMRLPQHIKPWKAHGLSHLFFSRHTLEKFKVSPPASHRPIKSLNQRASNHVFLLGCASHMGAAETSKTAMWP